MAKIERCKINYRRKANLGGIKVERLNKGEVRAAQASDEKLRVGDRKIAAKVHGLVRDGIVEPPLFSEATWSPANSTLPQTYCSLTCATDTVSGTHLGMVDQRIAMDDLDRLIDPNFDERLENRHPKRFLGVYADHPHANLVEMAGLRILQLEISRKGEPDPAIAPQAPKLVLDKICRPDGKKSRGNGPKLGLHLISDIGARSDQYVGHAAFPVLQRASRAGEAASNCEGRKILVET